MQNKGVEHYMVLVILDNSRGNGNVHLCAKGS